MNPTKTEIPGRSNRTKRIVGSSYKLIYDSSSSDEEPSSPMMVKHICKFCLKEFKLNCILQRHRCKNMINMPSYPCDKCGIVYNRNDRLASHLRIKHNQNPAVKQVYHKCDMCDKKFARLGDVSRHKSVMHLQYISEHQKKVDVNVVAKKSSNTSLFKCLQCEKLFSTRYNMKIHMKVLHDCIKEFKCLSCPREFGLKVMLDKHVRAVHLKQDLSSMFQCTKCHLRFTQKSNLITHQQIHDANRKLFKCEVCTQMYTRKAALDKHSCPYN